MLMYKSEKPLKEPLKTRSAQLLSASKNLERQTSRDSNNIRTITRTRNNSLLNQKRKLKVYKENDKVYIDHSAAYALGLTDVRAVMIDKPHLFEISLNKLLEIQQDNTIEIEYQGLDRTNNENDKQQSNVTNESENIQEAETILPGRRVLVGASERTNSTSKRQEEQAPETISRGRRILLSVLEETKASDMEGAKQILEEGLREPKPLCKEICE